MDDQAKRKVFQEVSEFLKKFADKYDEKTIRWAVNKFMTAKKEKAKLLERKAELEQELKDVESVLE